MVLRGGVVSYIHKQNDICCHFQSVYCEKNVEEMSEYEIKSFFFCKTGLLSKMS